MFEPTAEVIAVPDARSTGRLFTDIWRTESGPSKRFGAPLAVADGDGIRSPGRDGECQGFARRSIRACASPATAHRLLPCRTNACKAPAAASLRPSKRASVNSPPRGTWSRWTRPTPGPRRPV